MRKIVLFLFMSSLVLFATETLKVDESMPWMFSWLFVSLLLVGLFFWGIYKSMKTKNPKYGYVILLSLLLLTGILFI